MGDIDGQVPADALPTVDVGHVEGPKADATRRRARWLSRRGHSPSPEMDADRNGYHGFISYSHAADGLLAPALQRGLQRFAKPWYRLRALRIFRDEASLSVNPHLWASICAALDASEFFILLASREAAASSWIAQETARWRETKPSERLLVGLTDGALVGDDDARDFDWERTTALPGQLRGAFAEEPRYVDLRWARGADDLSLSHPRFRDAVAEFAAPLHHRPKDELGSEEVRQHRRTLWMARSAVCALVTLIVIAVIASVLFLGQRNTARAQQRLALSRQLAAQALVELQAGTVDRGLLLGLESYRLADTTETRGSLIGGLEATPYLIAYLRGHTDAVNGVAFSPDGKILASASNDKTIILWDTTTERILRTLRGHTSAVDKMAFSPDSTTLTSVGSDGTVIVWDVASGRLVRALRGEGANGIAFSPDGKIVALSSEHFNDSLGREDAVVLWDVTTGQVLRTLHGLSGAAFNPNGKTLASISVSDATVILSDVATGRTQKLQGHLLTGTPVAFSPDGKTVASSGLYDNTVILWDVASGEPRQILRGHMSTVTQVAFSPDGNTLASSSWDRTIIVWDARTGLSRQTLRGHTAHVTGVAFSPDGKTLASSSEDRTVMMWDVGAGRQVRTVLGHTTITGVGFSPGAKTLASTEEDGTVTIWNAASGQHLQTLDSLDYGNDDPSAISPDITTLASYNHISGDVVLRDTINGRTLLTLPAPPAQTVTASPNSNLSLLPSANPITAMAFSPDGKILAIASSSVPRNATFLELKTTVTLWNVPRREPLRTLRLPGLEGSRLTFSPDGKTFATADSDGIKIWRVRDGKHVRTLPEPSILSGSNLQLQSFVFSPDDKLVASVNPDNAVDLWDVTTGRRLRTLRGQTDLVTAVAFSPNGKALASASDDRTVILWDVATGLPIHTLRGHTSYVFGVAFSADGKTLASASADHTAVLWEPLPTSRDASATRDTYCGIVRRNLTYAEWRQFLPGRPYHKTCPGSPDPLPDSRVAA